MNKQYAKQVLSYIKDHPDTYNQQNWRCGTACCFAGHLALLNGWRWLEPEEDFPTTLSTQVIRDDRILFVEDAAKEALGLPVGVDCYDKLFESNLILKDIEQNIDNWED